MDQNQNPDPDFTDQDQYTSMMKEENQNADSIDQDLCKSEIKEESENPYYAERDHYTSDIKEENQDPDYYDQDLDPTKRSKAGSPSGPADQQVCVNESPGSVYHPVVIPVLDQT